VDDFRRLITEIHRRSVWQILALYLVSGWVAYEVVQSLTEGLALPAWLPGAAVVILIAGLPIVLATAFVQAGGTAAGVDDRGRRAPSGADAAREAGALEAGGAGAPEAGGSSAVAARDAGARHLTWRNVALGGLAAVALVALAAAAWTFARPDPATPVPPDGPSAAGGASETLDPTRIAVLYFDDLSREGELQYLADGFTEALIHELAQVDRLRVVSRNGVRPYRDTDLPLDSVARALSAGTLVEGSLERVGDRLRAFVQLIDGATSEHLLSRSIERDGDDLLALRDDIVREAAELLRRRLGEELRLRSRPEDVGSDRAWELVQRAQALIGEAGDLYSDGASEAALRTLDRVEPLLVEAESLAPRWPLPVVRRGNVAFGRAVWGPSDGREAAFAAADAHAARALALVPDDPDALRLRGSVAFQRTFLANSAPNSDSLHALAEDYLRAALRTAPDRADILRLLSSVLQARGRFAEAEQVVERAFEHDPFLEDAERILTQLCTMSLERVDDAGVERHCGDLYRRFPDRPIAVYLSLWALWDDSAPDIDRAWELVEAGRRIPAEVTRASGVDAYELPVAAMLARVGARDSARAVLRRARERTANEGPDHYGEAFVLLNLGERDSAVASLRLLLRDQPGMRSYLTSDRAWEELWNYPPFQELVGTADGGEGR
jgi:TolB-like protein